MTGSNEPNNGLAAVLDRQVAELGHMLEGLEAEHAALTGRDIDALHAAMDRKTESLANIEQIDRQRLACVGTSAAMAQAVADDSSIASRWERIRTLGVDCQKLNEFNGRLINGQRRLVQNTLEIMRVVPKSESTYGPDGGNREAGPYRKHLSSA